MDPKRKRQLLSERFGSITDFQKSFLKSEDHGKGVEQLHEELMGFEKKNFKRKYDNLQINLKINRPTTGQDKCNQSTNSSSNMLSRGYHFTEKCFADRSQNVSTAAMNNGNENEHHSGDIASEYNRCRLRVPNRMNNNDIQHTDENGLSGYRAQRLNSDLFVQKNNRNMHKNQSWPVLGEFKSDTYPFNNRINSQQKHSENVKTELPDHISVIPTVPERKTHCSHNDQMNSLKRLGHNQDLGIAVPPKKRFYSETYFPEIEKEQKTENMGLTNDYTNVRNVSDSQIMDFDGRENKQKPQKEIFQNDVHEEKNCQILFEGRTLLKGGVKPRHIPKTLIERDDKDPPTDPRIKANYCKLHVLDLLLPAWFQEWFKSCQKPFTRKNDNGNNNNNNACEMGVSTSASEKAKTDFKLPSHHKVMTDTKISSPKECIIENVKKISNGNVSKNESNHRSMDVSTVKGSPLNNFGLSDPRLEGKPTIPEEKMNKAYNSNFQLSRANYLPGDYKSGNRNGYEQDLSEYHKSAKTPIYVKDYVQSEACNNSKRNSGKKDHVYFEDKYTEKKYRNDAQFRGCTLQTNNLHSNYYNKDLSPSYARQRHTPRDNMNNHKSLPKAYRMNNDTRVNNEWYSQPNWY